MSATSVNPPMETTNILVDTRTARKVVFLPPAALARSGKLYFIKDICGNCAASTIFISTVGNDTFDNKPRASTAYAIMSTNFQSVLLMSDGVLNWYILQNYISNAVFSPNFFTPTSLTASNLSLWLDGNDTSTQVTNTALNVVTWRDKSGAANDTTARSGISIQAGGAINGRNAILFTNSYFTGPFSVATQNTGTTAHAFFVGTLRSIAEGAARPLSLGRPGVSDTNQTTTTAMFIRNSGPDLRIFRNNVGAQVTLPGYDTPFLIQSNHNGTTESISVNGNLTETTANSGTTAAFNITSYAVGVTTELTGGALYYGYMGEIIYYRSVLSTANRQKVEGYLAWKWGLQGSLPVQHPFKYVPPRN